MPRCKKHRCCRNIDGRIIFKPAGTPIKQLSITEINLDEFEAIRLCDYEGYDQTVAGKSMNISRGTVQRLLTSGRKKLIEALLNKNVLIIKENYKEEKK